MLERYPPDPAAFPRVFEANLAVVNDLAHDRRFVPIFDRLAAITGIERDIIILECKRYLMVMAENTPEKILHVDSSALLSVRFLLRMLLGWILGFCTPASSRRATLFVDEWSAGVMENFYGPELAGRWSAAVETHVCHWARTRGMKLADMPKAFKGFLQLLPMLKACFTATGLCMRGFAYYVLQSYLTGRFFRTAGKQVTIISGDDNGFNALKAKAAGMRVVLVQNGLRGLLPDSTFKHADIYVAMGGDRLSRVQQDMGSRFLQVRAWGSLRLARHLAKAVPPAPITYDVAWISNWPITLSKGEYAWYYGAAYERAAIALLVELAKSGRYRIAYQCRYLEEVSDLKMAGIYSPQITYFFRAQQPVYATVEQSRIIISTGSTVNLEAMSLGKNVCFVNLSPNRYLNHQFASLRREYTAASTMPFEQFIADIDSRPATYEGYASQHPDMMDRLVDLVARPSEKEGA